MLELSNLCHCVQHPWKLTCRDFWSSRNKRKPPSKQKCIWRKYCRLSLKQWMWELSNLCHCVQHPWKFTGRDFWSSRNKRKPLSKHKNVFGGNVVGYLINGECWELSNLCHCVQHPWKLTCSDFWSSRNKRKPLSKQICVFGENAVDYLTNSECWELSNLYHCVQHPWKFTGRDFWSSRNKRKPLSKQKCIWRKCSRVSHKWWMWELSNLCHCVQHPWKLTCRDFWSSRNKRKPLSKQICVWRKYCRLSLKQWILELSNLSHCIQHPWNHYL